MTHTEQAVRDGKVFTPEYFRAIRRDAQGEPKTDPSINYPKPEHTSRDPWPDGRDMPGPVATFRTLAESHGWAVHVQYSRGRHPHGSTGRPTAVKEWFGLQALHPESRARVIAFYDGGAWKSVHLITRGEMSSRGSITDAQEFVRLCGRVLQLPSWVLGRAAQRERIAAERAATKPPRERKASASAKREHGG